MIARRTGLALGLMALLYAVAPLHGQWTNRYPKIDGLSHHVYLEGYELPTLTNGPMDPAPSPDGSRLAFASRGWIWMLDLETGVASRMTEGGGLDSRPAWSPDGRILAFVRDDTHDTHIVVADATTGAELATMNSPGIELDPAFSTDGTKLFYSSAEAGTLDLWAFDVETGERRPVTDDRGSELRPQPGADRLVYLAKGGGGFDRVMLRSSQNPEPTPVIEAAIASLARPALSPDGSMIAVNWPTQTGWELRLHLLDDAAPEILLESGGRPLTPAWSPDGEWIYYSEADATDRMRLYKVRAVGGPAVEVPVHAWDWGGATATLRIRTTREVGGPPVPARLNVVDGNGHPAVPEADAVRFDGENGRVFFYTPGVVELTMPVGEVTVGAVQGLATPEQSETITLLPQYVTEVELVLEPVWDARANGWTSGEHHFHLNYGGPYDLSPDDLVPMMQGEALDVATPLVANLHNRFGDQDLWGWEKSDGSPIIRFGQEVRSHFLGHLGLIEINELFWPWVWGPGYQVYGTDDRENAEALGHARAQGGIGFYVHPVSPGNDRAQPWDGAPLDILRGRVPIELIPDAILGDLDAIELVCLWSDEVSTAAIWHRLLNVGIPIVPSAGTDVMTNFYRTMAVGTARVYAQTGGAVNWPAYVEALREGRTFVTNGPFLEFQVGGAGPGEITSGGATRWSLSVSTATGVDRVEVLVNGEVVWSQSGLEGARTYEYESPIDLPSGGWVAARAVGGEVAWPMMANYPYAHTGPTWIGSVGSTESGARAQAAQELLDILETARNRLTIGYGGAEIPNLLGRFDAAQARLQALVSDAGSDE